GGHSAHAQGIVICAQQPGGQGESQNDKDFCAHLGIPPGELPAGGFQKDQHQQSQEQGKQGVLMHPEKGPAVQGQIKGNLRERREEQQVSGVAEPAAGVEKSLHQQKGKQRESNSSHQAA